MSLENDLSVSLRTFLKHTGLGRKRIHGIPTKLIFRFELLFQSWTLLQKTLLLKFSSSQPYYYPPKNICLPTFKYLFVSMFATKFCIKCEDLTTRRSTSFSIDAKTNYKHVDGLVINLQTWSSLDKL